MEWPVLLGSLNLCFSVGFSQPPALLVRGVGLPSLCSHSTVAILGHWPPPRCVPCPLSLGAGTATSHSGVPGLQVNHLEKLDPPALCVNTVDPAASPSSLTLARIAGRRPYKSLMKLQHRRHLNKDP